jgi:hypothetical protein
MGATKEADLAKLGALTAGPGLPDALKKAPLSMRSPSDIHLQFRHSLLGGSPSRFVTCRNCVQTEFHAWSPCSKEIEDH